MSINRAINLQNSFEISANPDAFLGTASKSLIGGITNSVNDPEQEAKRKEKERANFAAHNAAIASLTEAQAATFEYLKNKYNLAENTALYFADEFSDKLKNLNTKAKNGTLTEKEQTAEAKELIKDANGKLSKDPNYKHLTPEQKINQASQIAQDLAKRGGYDEVYNNFETARKQLLQELEAARTITLRTLGGAELSPEMKAMAAQVDEALKAELGEDNFNALSDKGLEKARFDFSMEVNHAQTLEKLEQMEQTKQYLEDEFDRKQQTLSERAAQTHGLNIQNIEETIDMLKAQTELQEKIMAFSKRNHDFVIKHGHDAIILKALQEDPEMYGLLKRAGIDIENTNTEELKALGIENPEETLEKIQEYGKLAHHTLRAKQAIENAKEMGCETRNDYLQKIYETDDQSQGWVTRNLGAVGDAISYALSPITMKVIQYKDPQNGKSYDVFAGTDSKPHYFNDNGEKQIITDPVEISRIRDEAWAGQEGATKTKPLRYADEAVSTDKLEYIWDVTKRWFSDFTTEEALKTIEKEKDEAFDKAIDETRKAEENKDPQKTHPQEEPKTQLAVNSAPELELKGNFKEAHDEQPKTGLSSIFTKAEEGLEEAGKIIYSVINMFNEEEQNTPEAPKPEEQHASVEQQPIGGLG